MILLWKGYSGIQIILIKNKSVNDIQNIWYGNNDYKPDLC